MAELTAEQQQALAIAAARRRKAESSAAPPADFGSSYAGQAVSGANEGIYNTLGAPVDAVNSAFSDPSIMDLLSPAMLPTKLAGQAYRALTGEEEVKKPVMGSKWLKDKLSATIAPPTGETGKDLTRAITRELAEGAPVAAGLYAKGANMAARGARPGPTMVAPMAAGAYARPGALAAGEVGGAIGAGAGGELGKAVGGSEGGIVGQLLGGISGGVLGNRIAGDTLGGIRGPSEDEIRKSASLRYGSIRENGAPMPGPIAGKLSDYADSVLRKAGRVTPEGRYASGRVKKVVEYINDFRNSGMTFEQFQNYRSEVINDAIDDAIKNGTGKEVKALREIKSAMSEAAEMVWPGLGEADKLYATAAKHKDLVTMPQMEAEAAAGPNYTASGVPQAKQREYTKLVKQRIKGRLPGVTESEAKIVDELSKGTSGFNRAKEIGKYTPRGPVSTGAAAGLGTAAGLALGPVAGIGTAAGVAGAGMAGRAAANRLQQMKVNELSELIRTGRYGGPRYLTDLNKAMIAQQLMNARK